ncbi:MAG: SpoIID/LytB domain-containing protein [Spirochaetales bacterium]|nr:SpoIID/LytB domain-containing protein [Spirochaetales bacterium]
MRFVLTVLIILFNSYSLGAQSLQGLVRVNLTGYAHVPQFTLGFSKGSHILINSEDHEMSSCDIYPEKQLLVTDQGQTVRFNTIVIRPKDVTSFTTRLGTQYFKGHIQILAVEDGVLIVNTVPVPDYLASVLGGEMGGAFCDEALKAQAVAIRSYYFAKKQRNKDMAYDVCNTDGIDMVYRGTAFATQKMYDIISQTKDLYLIQGDGNVAVPLFHSTSGGWILKDEVFSSDYYNPPIRPVLRKDVDDRGAPLALASPYFEFDVTFTSQEIARALSPFLKINNISDIKLTYFEGTECVDFIGLVDGSDNIHWLKAFKFVSLIQQSGTLKLGSIQFVVKKQGDSFRFIGKGFGHQCGMSQFSADALGRNGCGFREILLRYYPQYRLVKISDIEEFIE